MREETRDLSLGQALDLGTQFAMAGQHGNAIGLFRGVLQHDPANFEAIERLGSSLFETGQHFEAMYWFWRGRKLDRKHPLALTNYGLCLSELGHPDEGLADLERAVERSRKSNLSPAAKALMLNNLGNALERLGRHKEALAVLEQGIRLDSTDPFPHYNRGIALLRLNRQKDAITALNTSLAMRHNMADTSPSRMNPADAYYNRGMARLLLGDLGGFEDYEHRLMTSENRMPNLNLPADKKWTGQDIDGKSLLVLCEQGLGDDIQFFRFLRELLKRHHTTDVRIVAHAATADLLDGLDIKVLRTNDELETYDYWVPLMSLPLRFGIKKEAEIPGPYMPPVTGERVDKWHSDLALPEDAFNIGVVWAGNFQHKNDRHRSIPLEIFATLFDAPGYNFISLQQMRPGEDAAFQQVAAQYPNLKAYFFDDLRDTAAAILALDMVVTVDTAVAHLAASLSVPTCILLPAFGTDWRWQLRRSDSPWYPLARLYRQPKVGDWKSVLEAVKRDLTALTQKSDAA